MVRNEGNRLLPSIKRLGCSRQTLSRLPDAVCRCQAHTRQLDSCVGHAMVDTPVAVVAHLMRSYQEDDAVQGVDGLRPGWVIQHLRRNGASAA